MQDFKPLGEVCDAVGDALLRVHDEVVTRANECLPGKIKITTAIIVFGVVGTKLRTATIRVPGHIENQGLAEALITLGEGIERDGMEFRIDPEGNHP